MIQSLGCAALAFLLAAGVRGEDAVVSLLDYFELGDQKVARELAGAGGEGRITAARAAHAAHAVVRLRIHFGFHDGAFSTTHATATLVDGGKHAVTVAHAAIVAFEHADSRMELVLDDGRVLGARARAVDHYDPDRPSTDWAVLDVLDPPAGLVALELSSAEPGERLVLGFPGRIGFGAGGRAELDDPGRGSALRPVRLLCRAEAAGAAQLELIAGAVPVGGMSGAPCIEPGGRIVGIQRAVSESSTGNALEWKLDVVGLEAIRAELAR